MNRQLIRAQEHVPRHFPAQRSANETIPHGAAFPPAIASVVIVLIWRASSRSGPRGTPSKPYLPQGDRSAAFPRFSSAPSDAEFFRARVFEEPLVPIGKTSSSENRALARQVLRYLEYGGGEGLAPVEEFLAAYPASSWRASILGNIGVVYRRAGHFSRALRAWEEAWTLSKGATDTLGRAVADRALGEYADCSRVWAAPTRWRRFSPRPTGGQSVGRLRRKFQSRQETVSRSCGASPSWLSVAAPSPSTGPGVSTP